MTLQILLVGGECLDIVRIEDYDPKPIILSGKIGDFYQKITQTALIRYVRH